MQLSNRISLIKFVFLTFLASFIHLFKKTGRNKSRIRFQRGLYKNIKFDRYVYTSTILIK